MDLYLHKYKVFTTIISSMMHMANIVSSILAVRFYTAGGWLAVGLGLAAFSCLPLILLPLIKGVQESAKLMEPKQGQNCVSINGNLEPCDVTSRDIKLRDVTSRNVKSRDKSRAVISRDMTSSDVLSPTKSKMVSVSMNFLQKMIYYIPDAALFLNNTLYNILIFNLTARMVTFSGTKLGTAILFVNLINVFSFLGALGLGFIADKLNVLIVMIFGNAAFYAGFILAFGSTTSFIQFPFDFELGSVLIGLGDAAVVNLSIMSKFELFERWGLPTQGLGTRSTETHNLVLNLSVASGIVLSGFTLSKESEIPVLCTAIAMFVVVTSGLILCKASQGNTADKA